MLSIKSFTFNPFQENTYVISHKNGDCIILDPGCYGESEQRELEVFIESQGLRPVLLVNTHCHLDHVFGNAWAALKYGLKLHLNRLELPLLENAPASGLMFDLPFDSYGGEFHFLEEGELLRLGDEEFEVIHTPGHSPGSLSFYHSRQSWLISGDALFHRSIGRTDLPGGDYETLLASIRSKLFTLPDKVRVFSGHGPSTTIAEEKMFNPFLQ
jgi:glyoxylase-like metal-dependent hydrolase (beta-lactamase superfamily II)